MDFQVVAMVVQFYGSVKFINSLQAERSTYIEKGKCDEFDEQYFEALKKILKRYKGQFEHMFKRYNLPKRAAKGAQS